MLEADTDTSSGLADRVIVISGGAGGIGRECVREFLLARARVHVVDVNPSALNRLDDEHGKSGAYSASVSDLGSSEACIEALRVVAGPVYGLVHLAGVYETDDVDPSSRTVWDRALASNLTTAFDMVAACVPRLDPAVGGRIVLTSSIAYRRGSFDHLGYSASKGGIAGFVRALSRRLAPQVLVNGVAPGIIDTSMPSAIIKERGERLRAEIPLARWGAPREIARVIRFLCSNDASYVTGQMLNVDGGMVNS